MRCDEGKPSCDRCVSTGRKCDGYETAPASSSDGVSVRGSSPYSTASTAVVASSQSFRQRTLAGFSSSASSSSSETLTRRHYGLPPQATADLKLALPRTDPEELRSYRYFLEVSAPAVAGCFDGKFWLKDIPRVCLTDPAIWHAVVCFGSVHERYSRTAGRSTMARNVFALRQFNSAIRCLTEPSSPRLGDRMRALTVSAIFTCVCVLDGQYVEARMHAKSGVKMLGEIDEEQREKRSLAALKTLMGPARPPQDLTRLAQDEDVGNRVSSWAIPISTASVRSIISSFELAEKSFASGGFEDLPNLLSDNERFGLWGAYTLPSTTPNGESPLTLDNIGKANRAMESLFHALALWTQENGEGLTNLLRTSNLALAWDLLSKQKPFIRCYRLIQRAIKIFEREFALEEGAARGANEALRLSLRRSFYALKCYCDTLSFIILGDPDDTDIIARYRSLPKFCKSAVDAAEQMIQAEAALRAMRVPLTPAPSIATPLYTVAFGGFSWPVRRRALRLLQVPRLDGLWDSLMAAGLAEAIIEREKESAREGAVLGQKTLMPPADPDDTEEEVMTYYRVYKTHITFTGKRQLELRLRTWKEVINEEYGRVSIIHW